MIFKCKMCGGDIVAAEGAAFGTCDSCGITSTLPKATDEKIVNLFNRANHFRRLNEFDRALGAYESILTEDNTNAEAHWCVALCRYGIEYVEDPKTGERVPTCHRASHEPIVTDADYLAALEHAEDGYARELYETEAKKINEIQKNILAISNREEPFDVFICYKETTDGGSRTKDSVIAQDIHDALTKEGLRVFFARITLENMLGAQYEPYIFGALNTAKVMLVIGTRKEHFEAVWVRNEWSRFLALMKKERAKTIVPCYRDMDAYDLPEELSMYQSQDMGKIGFIQDLIRGVKKITDTGKKKEVSAVATATTSQGANATVNSLLKRVFIFLEDGDFTQAAQYAEKVLDADPENARAYIAKLLIELKLKQEDDLRSVVQDLKKHDFFQKALRFADADYKRLLNEYAEQASKNAHRHDRLNLAREKANDFATFSEAIKALEEFPNDEEADAIMEQMQSMITNFVDTAINSHDIPQKYEYARKLKELGELFNAEDHESNLLEQAEHLTESAIEQARQYAQEATALNQKPILAAISLIEPLADWNKNAANILSELNERQQVLKKEASKIALKKRKRTLKIVTPLATATIIIGFIVIYYFSFGFADFRYDKVYASSSGLSLYSNSEGNVVCVRRNGKKGYINRFGLVVIPFIYDELGPYSESKPIKARKDGVWGFINADGSVVYDYIDNSSESDLLRARNDGLWGFINTDGSVAIPFIYDEVGFYFADNPIMKAKKDGLWGFINADGSVVIPFIYDELESYDTDRPFKVKKDGLWGFIDGDGSVVIPFIYDELGTYSTDGPFRVKKDGLWGFIDGGGLVVIPFIYDELDYYYKSRAMRAEKDGKWGIIDGQGFEVAPFIYDEMKELQYAGRASVRKGETWKDIKIP